MASSIYHAFPAEQGNVIRTPFGPKQERNRENGGLDRFQHRTVCSRDSTEDTYGHDLIECFVYKEP